jgi:hypothetical protein
LGVVVVICMNRLKSHGFRVKQLPIPSAVIKAEGGKLRVVNLNAKNCVGYDVPLSLGVAGGRVGQHFKGELDDGEPASCPPVVSGQTRSSGRRSRGDVPEFRNVLHPAAECVAPALQKVQSADYVLMLRVRWMDQPQQNTRVEQIAHQSWSS